MQGQHRGTQLQPMPTRRSTRKIGRLVIFLDTGNWGSGTLEYFRAANTSQKKSFPENSQDQLWMSYRSVDPVLSPTGDALNQHVRACSALFTRHVAVTFELWAP